MEKIASFTVDHTKLKPGLYVSRKDIFHGTTITTFDLRITAPNKEPVMGTAEVHTLEHLGATYLRNHADWKNRVVYWGPMGCRTGFYAIFEGDLTPQDVLPILTETFQFMADFQGEIPGATPHDCGNHADMSLNMARLYAHHYLASVLQDKNMQTVYPQ